MATRWAMDNGTAAEIAERTRNALNTAVHLEGLRIPSRALDDIQGLVYASLIANCYKPID